MDTRTLDFRLDDASVKATNHVAEFPGAFLDDLSAVDGLLWHWPPVREQGHGRQVYPLLVGAAVGPAGVAEIYPWPVHHLSKTKSNS